MARTRWQATVFVPTWHPQIGYGPVYESKEAKSWSVDEAGVVEIDFSDGDRCITHISNVLFQSIPDDYKEATNGE